MTSLCCEDSPDAKCKLVVLFLAWSIKGYLSLLAGKLYKILYKIGKNFKARLPVTA
jgi:hypothetical protein